jgi:hypothetical protein
MHGRTASFGNRRKLWKLNDFASSEARSVMK